MADLATEDMLSMQLHVAGQLVTGFGPGQPVRWEPSQDQFGMRAGVGGLTSFHRIIDLTGTLSIDLLPNSDGNDFFTRLFLFSTSTSNGINYASTWVDTSGRFSLQSDSAMFTRQPSMAWGEGGGLNTWALIGKWRQVTGGRAPTPVVEGSAVPELADIPGIRAAT